MAWRNEKTEAGNDLVWEGVETGISVSPLKGTANIQNANIATDTGEVLASFARTNQAFPSIPASPTPTLTASVINGTEWLASNVDLRGGAWIRILTSTISGITPPSGATTVEMDYLVVAGGGGGGYTPNPPSGDEAAAGGGGAGEVAIDTFDFSVGSYPITVGRGGIGGSIDSSQGEDGFDSEISGVYTSAGGGGGGGGTTTSSNNGRNGGYGGGGGASNDGGIPGVGGVGSAGFDGGDGIQSIAANGGGGGGASENGADAIGTEGGDGGDGVSSSITGTSVTYGGGGGGGAGGNPANGAGEGGSGGGGNGGMNAEGSDAEANTGGGGGGSGSQDQGGAFDGGDGGSGIVVISYPTGSVLATGGTIERIGANTIHTFTDDGLFEVVWINEGGYYYVSQEDSTGRVKISENYDPYGDYPLTHGTSGTATFELVGTMGRAISKATEKYNTATTTEYRYYVLDNAGYVWCYDTQTYADSLATNGVAITWMMVDPIDYSSLGFSGMGVINGWLTVISNSTIYGKPTVDLGTPFAPYHNGKLSNPFPTHTNFAYTGKQGKLYYTDGNYIGEIFPTTSFLTQVANVQSYASYTAVGNTGTISALIGGSLPYVQDSTGAVERVPAVFFSDENGTQPTNLDYDQVYWIEFDLEAGTFKVYFSRDTGDPVSDLTTGATGNQYFNTFYPRGPFAGADGEEPTLQFTQQRVNLPYDEQAQCMVEVGNTIIIGGTSNTLYPWNQIDATPSDFIALPESGVKSMVNVNNMVYVFAGNKGNVYITNNSVASLVLKIPDYCAGVPGTSLSYVEPYFEWGDSMYMRGRVYFSVLDQTATKAGNCGGVWSFIPTQNFYVGQDIGMALRLENQNSYGDYDGMANILIPSEQQEAIGPQYWSFWMDSYNDSVANFGADFTSSNPVTSFVVETDLLPTGTFLTKRTFSQIEFKLTQPLASGDSVALYWRTNSTGSWTALDNQKIETSNPISGYYDVNFQKSQWIQLRAVVTTNGTTTSAFGRLCQIRVR